MLFSPKRQRTALFLYLLLHLLPLPLFFLLPRYVEFTGSTPLFTLLSSCFFHTVLCIYCPTCGFTRSLSAILSCDLLSSLRYYPVLPIGLLILLYFDLRSAVTSLKKKRLTFYYSKRFLFFLFFFFLVYIFLRNLLLLFEIDPVGDFYG